MTIQLFPLESSPKIRRNTLPAELIEIAIRRGEGKLSFAFREGLVVT